MTNLYSYLRNLSLNEILTIPDLTDLSEEEKIIYTIAFYDKNNYPEKVINNYLKKVSKTFSTNNSIIELISHLKSFLKNKPKIFDINVYLSFNILKKNPQNQKTTNMNPIICHELKEMLKAEDYANILNICNNETYANDPNIQSFKLKVLYRLKKDNEAKILRRKFPNNSMIQLVYINYLIANKRYKKALKKCSRNIFRNDSAIQKNRIKLLLMFERYEEAYVIASDPLFAKEYDFQDFKRNIERYFLLRFLKVLKTMESEKTSLARKL